MNCANCTKAAMRDAADTKRDRTLRDMAKAGLVNCLPSPFRASFMPALAERDCSRFNQAPTDVAAKRVAWFSKVIA